MKNTLLLTILFLSLLCQAQNITPKYETRAVWVATVANIDYPSRSGLSSQQQQAEYTALLDSLQKCRINTVIVQIRPTADAFYPSKIDPWSAYLTGQQGKAPSPAYDPLAFMIEQSHKRGIEFHAWLNPYRISTSADLKKLSPTNQAIKNPSWRVLYGGKYYFNPGIPQVRAYLINVVKDLCERYDLDGVHLDDYFYPYPVKGVPFPDQKQYEQYGKKYANISDWRRDNVNQLVRSLHKTILSINPNIKFGISPFGIYRREPSDKSTLSNYDDLYADVLLWTDSLWVDYLTPQLYWEDSHPVAPYGKLLSWWGENITKTHLYIGHGLYNIDSKSPKPVWRDNTEIIRQIQTNRLNPKTSGSSLYSAKHLRSDHQGVATAISKQVFTHQALTPVMPWKDISEPPAPVSLSYSVSAGKPTLKWKDGEPAEDFDGKSSKTRYFLIYRFEGGKVPNLNDSKAILSKVWLSDKPSWTDPNPVKGRSVYVVTAVSANSVESENYAYINTSI